jgi:hypothetical protein
MYIISESAIDQLLLQPSHLPNFSSSPLPTFPTSHLLFFRSALCALLSALCLNNPQSINSFSYLLTFPPLFPFSQNPVQHNLGIGGGIGTGTVAAYVGGGLAFDNLQTIRVSGKLGQPFGIFVGFYDGDFIR